MLKSNNIKTDKLIPNKPNKINERPPSVNTSRSTNKEKEKPQKAAASKEKNILSNLFLTSSKNNLAKTNREKNQKHVKLMDNSLDNKDAMDFIDLIQEQGNNNNLKNVNNNNNNFNRENKTENSDLHKHFSSMPEAEPIKITPNIAEINNLLANSQQALSFQKNLLENFSELNKKLCVSEFEIQKLTGKLDSEEFAGFSDKYSASLDKVIEKLKNHSEEMENIKCKFNFIFIF
jgi:hypothetical protein